MLWRKLLEVERVRISSPGRFDPDEASRHDRYAIGLGKVGKPSGNVAQEVLFEPADLVEPTDANAFLDFWSTDHFRVAGMAVSSDSQHGTLVKGKSAYVISNSSLQVIFGGSFKTVGEEGGIALLVFCLRNRGRSPAVLKLLLVVVALARVNSSRTPGGVKLFSGGIQ